MANLTFDIDLEFWPLYERCKPFTMTSMERMYALWGAVRHISTRRIPGDVVECGVWRGGSMMLVALTLAALGDTGRRLWLYDTYEGMTEPSAADVQHMSGRPASEILATATRSLDDPFWAVAPREAVEQNLRSTGYPAERLEFVAGKVEDTLAAIRSTGYPDENVVFVVGRVEETVPSAAPERIALLRLDTDWYDSTRIELEVLYPRLAPKGLLIIDDYGYWRGARTAVDEYFAGREDAPFLGRIDYTGRIGAKT
jgi:hypothetical protein